MSTFIRIKTKKITVMLTSFSLILYNRILLIKKYIYITIVLRLLLYFQVKNECFINTINHFNHFKESIYFFF